MRTWMCVRCAVMPIPSGPKGQTWSVPDALRLGSRGNRLRSATDVGASSTISPQRWHSQRRAGGYARAHQSCVLNWQVTRFMTWST